MIPRRWSASRERPGTPGRISHPNVCAVYDFGTTPAGMVYLAMEYVEGRSLGALLLEEGRLVGAVTRSDLLGVLRQEAAVEPRWRPESDEGRTFRTARNVSGLMESRLPAAVVRLIGRLGEAARRLGMEAYLVGGFVRDLLLNLPNLDLDVVVEGDGILFAREVSRKLGGRVRSHRKFETTVVILPDGFKGDVATARLEY